MEIQWMVATSNQISDIVQGWSRKASSHGLHLVPIPNDPFALPMSGNADPLRGPIFVNVDLDSLPPEARSYLQGETKSVPF
jgi:DEP domain containing protein (fragment)